MINSNLDMTYSVRGRPYSVRINDWEFLFEFCSLGNLFVRFLFLFVFWWLSLASFYFRMSHYMYMYLSKLPHPPPVELLEAGILASWAIMQAFVYVRVARKTEHLLALSAHGWGLIIVVMPLTCPDINFSSAGETVFSYPASFLYIFEWCYWKQMVIRAS